MYYRMKWWFFSLLLLFAIVFTILCIICGVKYCKLREEIPEVVAEIRESMNEHKNSSVVQPQSQRPLNYTEVNTDN